MSFHLMNIVWKISSIQYLVGMGRDCIIYSLYYYEHGALLYIM